MSFRSLLKVCVPAALLLGGCAHVANVHGKQAPATSGNTEDVDSLEGFNRGIYQFNYVLDGVVLKPVATVYRGVVPETGRTAVSNVLINLYTPVVFINSVLQGDPKNSFATLWRFILNTTFGLGGIYDFAANDVGLKNRPADFGETLAMWGVESGPYLVLPLIGPSNFRDATGRLADLFMNPFTYAPPAVTYSIWGATVVDSRSNNMKLIDDVYSSSLDPYSTFRSGYTQKRKSDIARAKAARKKALETLCGTP